MNILITGAFGREHALAEMYTKSKKVKKVYVAPGNGLMDYTNKKIVNCPNVAMLDFDGVLKLCKKHKIDLVDVAQDDVIAVGFVDKLQRQNITAFGPSLVASKIEWDKQWARDFMQKYTLPIPHFKSFSDEKKAIAYVNKLDEQLLYIKASGLCGGKGAVRAENKQEAFDAIASMKTLGAAGETFLVEEGMIGEEFSLFVICDEENYVITKAAQDHKTALNKDLGPNTGGMGCVAPPLVINKKILQETETTIIKPLLAAMKKEGRPYSGILYLGGMITGKGVKIIEFNARWGDPEAEVILPSIKTDYLSIVESVLAKKLHKLSITFDDATRVSVAACSQGYPVNHKAVIGKEIFGIDAILKLPYIQIYGSGITRKGKRFFANGGRIFHIVAEGKDIVQARRRVYEAMAIIFIEGNNLHYRTDIGWRDFERIKNKL